MPSAQPIPALVNEPRPHTRPHWDWIKKSLHKKAGHCSASRTLSPPLPTCASHYFSHSVFRFLHTPTFGVCTMATYFLTNRESMILFGLAVPPPHDSPQQCPASGHREAPSEAQASRSTSPHPNRGGRLTGVIAEHSLTCTLFKLPLSLSCKL